MTIIAEETLHGENIKRARKRASTDRKMYREEIKGERFLISISGTFLGAAYENTTYCCVKAIERVKRFINQGGTAGYPVPRGIGCPAFILLWERACNTKA